MKILVLNGSPKNRNKSNTFKVSSSFLDGLNSIEKKIKIIDINKKDIKPCLGCFKCWTDSPGICIIKDDMVKLINEYIEAELIIWSFPLYYFGMPSQSKSFLDRLLPLNLPIIEQNEDGSPSHPSRYDFSNKKYILISTCGFFSKENNYEALVKQFELIYGEDSNKFNKILIPEGELFSIPQFKKVTNDYLDVVKTAGEEFTKYNHFSKDTEEKLNQVLIDKDTFIEMANLSWDIKDENSLGEPNLNNLDDSKLSNLDESKLNKLNESNLDKIDKKILKSETYRFLKQMAIIYNKGAVEKGKIVIEFYFTDTDEKYQLILSKQNCEVKYNDFSEYSTRIDVSFKLWKEISEGKINGAEAMMNKQYKVSGDFNTMMNMDDYFSTNLKEDEKVFDENKTFRKTNMGVLLLPWIIFWIIVPINPIIGGAISITGSTFLILLEKKFSFTWYDNISIFLVSLFGVLAILRIDILTLLCVSYISFGLMWLISGFLKIPLSAYYSSNDYGYKKAFENPLFIKTNRILSIEWGILYLILLIFTIFISYTSFFEYVGLINSIAPALMGIYTAWFSKWYPAHVAKG